MGDLPKVPRPPVTPRTNAARTWLSKKQFETPTIPTRETKSLTLDTEKSFEERFAPAHAKKNFSRAEFVVYEYLTINKHQKEGRDFIYQYPVMGGRSYGGGVLDFYLIAQNMAWPVQGEFFHISKAKDRAKDILQRFRLVEMGMKVVDLYAKDLQERPLYVLNAAWEGREAVRSPERFF